MSRVYCESLNVKSFSFKQETELIKAKSLAKKAIPLKLKHESRRNKSQHIFYINIKLQITGECYPRKRIGSVDEPTF